MHERSGFGESAEMYLKSIVELASEESIVPISALASRLGITVVSTTEMIHRMEDEGLVVHTPYKGVALTEHGQETALSILRRQRLWECFLFDRLGLPWERIYDLACQLEHAVGAEVTEALASYLDHPQTCPHGNPIPSAEGSCGDSEGVPLSDLLPGEDAIVRRVDPSGAGSLSFLAERGLTPGANFTIKDIETIDGLRTLDTGMGNVVLGSQISQQVFVDRIPTPERDRVEG